MRFRYASLMLAFAAAAPAAGAQAKPASAAASAAKPDSLPPARTIIARYIAAIGGREAILKKKSMRSTGTFEMPAAGLKGDLTIVQAAPDRSVMRVSIPGLGEILNGYDGTVGWSVNPMQGARVLEGKELAAMREDAGIRSILREGEGRTVETVGKSEIAGEACWQVKVSYASGRSVTECYSVASGLMLGTSTTQESPMGAIQMNTLVSDFKDFGGLKIPTSVRVQAMGSEQRLTITNVVYDSPEDATAFERPAAVTTILEQKKAGTTSTP